MNVKLMKFFIATGLAGLATMLGGYDTILRTLLVFMLLDYALGIINPLILKRSKKSETGKLDSCIGLAGIVKKLMILFTVLIAVEVDILIGGGSTLVRNGVIVFYIINESISIFEHMEVAGIKVPEILRDSIERLKGGKHERD